MEINKIYHGDCIEVMKTWADAFVQTCVTSPPYWGLRDYAGCDCSTKRFQDGHTGGGAINYRSETPEIDCVKCHGTGRLSHSEKQFGMESSPEAYVCKMVEVFREVRRVLRDDGTLWLNLGDSYIGGGRGGSDHMGNKQRTNGGSHGLSPTGKIEGLKPKDLCGIPWRVAFALQADGWYLRSDIIWHKPNPMPESVTDRPTKAHEYIFLLTKSEQYFYDQDAIKEPAITPIDTKSRCAFGSVDGKNNTQILSHSNEVGKRWNVAPDRNKRSVWTVATRPYSEAHFATFPADLIKPCILAGSKAGDIVFDPFMGAGTTALVAAHYDRRYLGTELNPDYVTMIQTRIADETAQIKMAI